MAGGHVKDLRLVIVDGAISYEIQFRFIEARVNY